ncbi:hypothetical protein A3L11_07835 [Thermococcus siculi]|uniref:Uncharacterized protein n=2 Tax=Thermococcus siculi TaxID=72803 RepID=A0A2Z2MYC8_9EURY|nr:hypothetical protein A3L11_07835 [Thermococcus siculi]
MSTPKNSGSSFRSKRDMAERLAFIRLYVKRLKENPDAVFKQQVKLVNSFLKSARDFPLTKEEYLRLKGELEKN